MYLATTFAKLGFFNEWVTHCKLFVKFPTLFFLFFFFSFAYCVDLFLKVYWKAYLALFRTLDFEKKNKHRVTVLVKIIIRSDHRLKSAFDMGRRTKKVDDDSND